MVRVSILAVLSLHAVAGAYGARIKARAAYGALLARAPTSRRAALRRWGFLIGATRAAGSAPAFYGFDSLDDDGNGRLDKVEFMMHMRDHLDSKGESDKHLRRRSFEWSESLYKFADIDGDGVLSHQEFEYARYLERASLLVAARESIPVSDFSFGISVEKARMRSVDTDDDGKVSEEELLEHCKPALRAWGWQGVDLDSPEVKNWMHHVFLISDRDGSGYIDSVPEFRQAGFLVFDGALESMLQAISRDLDANRSGTIEWEEVEEADDMTLSEAPAEGFTLHQLARDSFMDVDLDGDGKLDLSEIRLLGATVLAFAA